MALTLLLLVTGCPNAAPVQDPSVVTQDGQGGDCPICDNIGLRDCGPNEDEFGNVIPT